MLQSTWYTFLQRGWTRHVFHCSTRKLCYCCLPTWYPCKDGSSSKPVDDDVYRSCANKQVLLLEIDWSALIERYQRSQEIAVILWCSGSSSTISADCRIRSNHGRKAQQSGTPSMHDTVWIGQVSVRIPYGARPSGDDQEAARMSILMKQGCTWHMWCVMRRAECDPNVDVTDCTNIIFELISGNFWTIHFWENVFEVLP